MDTFEQKRIDMVHFQIKSRGITNQQVLTAMKKVPRHLFVSKELQSLAYADMALGIAANQTISQPYIVGLMTALGDPNNQKKVLEIGTGSGYQTAILAELCQSVVTVEIIPELHYHAQKLLTTLNYKNIKYILGNGYDGYPEDAPYDIIIITAAPAAIPEKLINQLTPTGKMIVPVGDSIQQLLLITKDKNGQIKSEYITDVRFVPMINK